jgi:adenylate cyclase
MARQPVGLIVRRTEFRCWIGIVIGNLASALLIFPGVYFIGPVFFPDRPIVPILIEALWVGIPYLAFGIGTGLLLIVRPQLRPATRWVLEQRTPTERERQVIATQPRRQATRMLGYWIVFPIWAIPYALYVIEIEWDPVVLAKFFNGVAFLAFVAWTLSYLLVERAIRPLLALAMADAPSGEPRTMGVFPRLLVAWTAAAGLPLWNIAVILFGLDEADRANAIPYIYMTCITAGIAGIIATAIAARAITDPLAKVRSGMRAVERGEFDADVPVDEASEIGVLQMGFNRMVHGLRERERISELFGRHVGPEVAQRALLGDGALGGERRMATALFVDVIASSTLAATQEPEDVVGLLNAFFDAVVRTTGVEGGFVNKFEGDGAMCIFGAPVDQMDHDVRALRAACALRRELARMPAGFDAAIGISSGLVVAGNVGSADRYEYTVIGDPVNEASRLCDAAKSVPSKLLASEKTASGAAGWREAGLFALRGRAEPTLAFEPLGSPELTQPAI